MEEVNSFETSAISHKATHKSQNEIIFHVGRIKRYIIPKSIMECKLNEAITKDGPPLWSSGQSSWLQIRRPGFDSRHYKKRK
jgi:hypothetical protein